jgi:hypothetical protein
MSYDIRLVDAKGECLLAPEKHDITGGTYAMYSTAELWLNVTYNYAPHFYRLLGEKGIRSIYGMTASDSLPILRAAAEQLGDDVDEDYWQPTEGNAKAALRNLIALAEMAPDGAVWDGD